MKEKRNFFIKLVIERKDNGKIIDLSKKQEIKIKFQGSEGQIISKDKRGTILTFEEGDKKYRVLMKIDKIKKGWFKDEIIGCTFEPLPKEEFKLYEPNFFQETWWEQTKKILS